MPDMGDHHDDEYESVDEYELIESLEEEIADSAHSGGSKISVIIGGLLLGAAAVFFLSEDTKVQPVAKPASVTKASAKRDIKVQKAPQAKPAPKPEKKTPSKVASDPAVPVKKSGKATVDDKIAKLLELNQIDKDVEAPGAVTGQKTKFKQTETPAVAPTPEPEPAPAIKIVAIKQPDKLPPTTEEPDSGPYTVRVFATPDAALAQDWRDRLMALGYRSQIAQKGKV
jgi:hypothetical protein